MNNNLLHDNINAVFFFKEKKRKLSSQTKNFSEDNGNVFIFTNPFKVWLRGAGRILPFALCPVCCSVFLGSKPVKKIQPRANTGRHVYMQSSQVTVLLDTTPKLHKWWSLEGHLPCSLKASQGPFHTVTVKSNVPSRALTASLTLMWLCAARPWSSRKNCFPKLCSSPKRLLVSFHNTELTTGALRKGFRHKKILLSSSLGQIQVFQNCNCKSKAQMSLLATNVISCFPWSDSSIHMWGNSYSHENPLVRLTAGLRIRRSAAVLRHAREKCTKGSHIFILVSVHVPASATCWARGQAGWSLPDLFRFIHPLTPLTISAHVNTGKGKQQLCNWPHRPPRRVLETPQESATHFENFTTEFVGMWKQAALNYLYLSQELRGYLK